MRMNFMKVSLLILGIGISVFSSAQESKEVLNWYNGKKPGMETEKAYKMLKKRKSSTVVVAVIDSGIDIEHEDLKGKIWVNADEIPANGIDDDKNGYIDDVYGWNFLGNSKGENLNEANLEKLVCTESWERSMTRSILKRFHLRTVRNMSCIRK
jgi:cell wall-associated protease